MNVLTHIKLMLILYINTVLGRFGALGIAQLGLTPRRAKAEISSRIF